MSGAKNLVDCDQHLIFFNFFLTSTLKTEIQKISSTLDFTKTQYILSLPLSVTHIICIHTHTINILHNHTSFFSLLSKRSNNSRQSKDNSSQISPVYLRELYFTYNCTLCTIYIYKIYTYRTDQKHLETTDLAIFSACPRLYSNHFI